MYKLQFFQRKNKLTYASEDPWWAPHWCPYPLSAFYDTGFIGRPSTNEEHTNEANSYFINLVPFVGNN